MSVNIQKCKNTNWNNNKEITAQEIAECMLEAAIMINHNTVKDNRYEFLPDKISKLTEKRLKTISKAYKVIADKHNKEQDKKEEEELIRINLAEFEEDFKSGNYNSGIDMFKNHTEAFTVVFFIRAFIAKAAKAILNKSSMKDTNHASRERDRLEKQLTKLGIDPTVIENKLNEFDDKWSFNEYMNDCKETIIKSLTEDGTGNDRACRIATKAVTIIKKYHTK